MTVQELAAIGANYIEAETNFRKTIPEHGYAWKTAESQRQAAWLDLLDAVRYVIGHDNIGQIVEDN